MPDGTATATEEERDPLATVTAVLYVVALAINVVILADFATKGSVSREARSAWARLTAPARATWRKRETYARERPHVIFDAIIAVAESEPPA